MLLHHDNHNIIFIHVLVMKKTMKVGPRVQWFNNKIKAAKQLCQKHERIKRKLSLNLTD